MSERPDLANPGKVIPNAISVYPQIDRGAWSALKPALSDKMNGISVPKGLGIHPHQVGSTSTELHFDEGVTVPEIPEHSLLGYARLIADTLDISQIVQFGKFSSSYLMAMSEVPSDEIAGRLREGRLRQMVKEGPRYKAVEDDHPLIVNPDGSVTFAYRLDPMKRAPKKELNKYVHQLLPPLLGKVVIVNPYLDIPTNPNQPNPPSLFSRDPMWDPNTEESRIDKRVMRVGSTTVDGEVTLILLFDPSITREEFEGVWPRAVSKEVIPDDEEDDR